jgi:hypothetical protein
MCEGFATEKSDPLFGLEVLMRPLCKASILAVTASRYRGGRIKRNLARSPKNHGFGSFRRFK